MSLKLTRPIVSIDLETTGVDPLKDRIVQIGVSTIYPDGRRTSKETMVNPGRPIPPEASECHHITDEMVAGAPTFESLAPGLHKFLHGKDYMGMNLERFDLLILDEEFGRCNLSLPYGAETLVIDVGRIHAKMNPRTLSDIYRHYTGKELDGAHRASADCEAVVEILNCQLDVYESLRGSSAEGLHDLCHQDGKQFADIARKIWIDAHGGLRFNFGKHKDELVSQHWDFVDWMKKKDFPRSTMDVLYYEEQRCLHGQ